MISLSQAKMHLRVDQNIEDDLILLYIDAAQDYIKNLLNSDIPGIGDSPPIIPSAIKSAALLIIGDLYQNREAGTAVEIKPNPAVMNLLYPYRTDIGI